MKVSRERELKLSAPPGFRLPESRARGRPRRDAARADGDCSRRYLDTDDLRLARFGVTLRHRTGEGWTLKLPAAADGDLLVRDELVFGGSVRRPPAEAIDLVQAYARARPVEPCARLRTLRTVVDVANGDGQRVGELVDDRVSSLSETRRVQASFRELELELDEDAPAKLVKRLVRLLESAGAERAAQLPKLVRAIGAPAQAPPDVAARRASARPRLRARSCGARSRPPSPG